MNYNSKTLLDVKFDKNVKGYDALQVDETLDQVIEDYSLYEKQSALDKNAIQKLEKENSELKERIRNNEIEIKRLSNLVDSIPNSPDVNRSNIEYLRRISKLENALYKRGVDPNKL